MKQYRITRENITQDSPDDCFLPPNDPIHELKIASYMGGLGAQAKLAEYRARVAEENNAAIDQFGMSGNDKAAYMKKHNIRPGSPAWFELWRGTPTKI